MVWLPHIPNEGICGAPDSNGRSFAPAPSFPWENRKSKSPPRQTMAEWGTRQVKIPTPPEDGGMGHPGVKSRSLARPAGS